MPTAVLDVDVSALPPAPSGLERYERALVLVRWRGRPVGQVTIAVADGAIAGERLREAALAAAGERISECRLREYLGLSDECAPLPPATVAVCTRDRPAELARCLDALAAAPDEEREVIVVDSASRDDATRRVAEGRPGVRYLREERPGLDRARNRALREARHEIVAFTDDDTVPDAGWLRALRAGFAEPRTLCVTGLTMPLELETEAQEWFERTNAFGRGFQRVVYDGARDDPFRVARIGAGANMALRRSVLHLVGGFDEALDAGTPAQSGGDHDMFSRILAAGFRIVYEPAALSWHGHRREWEAVRRAVRGYGTGVYAFLAKQLLERREVGAPLVALAWMGAQLPALARSALRRPGSAPLDLGLAELRGCLAGPRAYLASRRAAARASE